MSEEQLVSAAQEDLVALRELLVAAGRGEVDPDELSSALTTYWRDRGPVIRVAGQAVLELARLQLLDQLYGWRAQLEAQLALRNTKRS